MGGEEWDGKGRKGEGRRQGREKGEGREKGGREGSWEGRGEGNGEGKGHSNPLKKFGYGPAMLPKNN